MLGCYIITITTHYIDDSWSLKSRIIRFVYVPCPHTAKTIADVLTECLLDWNFDNKSSTLIVDSCSTNDSMVDILFKSNLSSSSLPLGGRLFHMCCCVHILNLIVKDGLNMIDERISRIH